MPIVHIEPVPENTSRGELLQFVAATGGIDVELLSFIEIAGRIASIEVPASREARLLAALEAATFAGLPLRVWSSNPTGDRVDEHFRRLAELLELESKAEAIQILEEIRRSSPREAEKSGKSLTDLFVQEGYPGLGGRYILSLAKRGGKPLPWTRIGPGTPVVLSALTNNAAGDGFRGVVCERREFALSIAFNEPPEDESSSFRVDIAADEAARLRQRQALDRARNARGDRLAHLRAILLGQREPVFAGPAELNFFDAKLDESQRNAVAFALNSSDIAVIHGPPGTGKTTTLVELIRQAVRRGDKVLVCAPSNLAVDNVLERLLACGEEAVRLGHPARVLPQLREHTLDLILEDHADVRQARKLAKEAYALFRRAGKWTRAKPQPGARREQREEGRALLADARRMEAQALEQILDRSPILCATTTGLDADILGNRRFNLLVIDEACQTTEPGCWTAIARADQVVLAGDHCQLPPTVLSQEASRRGFGVSLLERLVDLYANQVTRRLDVQYRMQESIMAFSANEFYDGTLQAHESVAGHRLCDLPGIASSQLTEAPVEFVDTAGAGYEEEKEPDGESRFNSREAALVRRRVEALIAAGLSPSAIAIIAPYAAQVRHLREQIGVQGVEIDSVDGFQGREKEAVLVSFVRSNSEGEIGFLADVRRTNVALTRARRKLIVVGDSATLSAHPFYARLFGYFESSGSYHTVWEEDGGP
jgi:superfamily I DNA and/or RNA helicase